MIKIMDKNGSNYFCHILGRDCLSNVMPHLSQLVLYMPLDLIITSCQTVQCNLQLLCCNANSYGNVNHVLHLLALTVLCNFIYFFCQIDQARLKGYKQIKGFRHSLTVMKDKGLQPDYS